MSFMEALKNRRSRYGITKQSTLSNEEIENLIKEVVKYTPSALNSQSARVVVLLQGEHDALWDLTMEALRKVVPAENFKATEDKINGFKNGYGTVLFFEDNATVDRLEKDYPLYAANFKSWSLQASGMNQLAVWTALAEKGIGASLQHYTELIEDVVRERWHIDPQWKMISQMPFGIDSTPLAEKEKMPIEERVSIHL